MDTKVGMDFLVGWPLLSFVPFVSFVCVAAPPGL